MIDYHGPIYIVGVGRSGTSMLMTLLNGHSQICFTPETHFLRYYLGSKIQQAYWENAGVAAFSVALNKDQDFQRLAIATDDLLAPFLSGERPFSLDEVYQRLLGIYLKRKGKSWIGDKDPRYIDYLDVLQRVAPDARLIHIYRDPRDMVLSKSKADWASHRPYWLNAMISEEQLREGRRKGRAIFGENWYELAYEDLLQDPTAALSALLGFLDLTFEPAMLNLEKSANELVDPAEMQWKTKTFQPVQAGNTEKWRKAFTPWQTTVIEAICREWFVDLGYQKAGLTASPLTALVNLGANLLKKPQQWLYHWQLTRAKRAVVE